TQDKDVRLDGPANVSNDGDVALFQPRHRVRSTRPFVAVEKIEPDDLQTAPAQLSADGDHALVVHVAAGTVRANEQRTGGSSQRGLEHGGGFLVSAHFDSPRVRQIVQSQASVKIGLDSTSMLWFSP